MRNHAPLVHPVHPEIVRFCSNDAGDARGAQATIAAADCAALCGLLRWGGNGGGVSCGAFVWTWTDDAHDAGTCQLFSGCAKPIYGQDLEQAQIYIKCVLLHPCTGNACFPSNLPLFQSIHFKSFPCRAESGNSRPCCSLALILRVKRCFKRLTESDNMNTPPI